MIHEKASAADAVPGESNIQLVNRTHLKIDGVDEVISYQDNEIWMKTALGILRIAGEKMQITDLSVNTHYCTILGQIDGIVYSKSISEQNKGFFKRLFS